MNDFIDECKNIVSEVQKLLIQNREWVQRYAYYAQTISAKYEKVKSKKNKFNEWAPLYLYTNLSEAIKTMKYSLRYLGQDVAKLKFGREKIIISTKKFDDTNIRDFDCPIRLDDQEWTSEKASKFRRHFSNCPERTDNSGKGNEEHRIESLLLTEFSKSSRKDKILYNIQPVRLAGVARFQMPTPLAASNIRDVKYSAWNGGGIDILSRIGTGSATGLCIMEIKDENVPEEPAAKAILQGLAYATFIRALLRSESGGQWWKIFGFSRKLPEHIKLPVVCVMPSIQNNDTSFSDKIIKLDKDSLHLNYLYFKERNTIIVDVVTSLKQCDPKSQI
jgi:hypothetical protein